MKHCICIEQGTFIRPSPLDGYRKLFLFVYMKSIFHTSHFLSSILPLSLSFVTSTAVKSIASDFPVAYLMQVVPNLHAY